ncbi:MAG: 2-oxoacid:acceptor oxidoreductase family protein [Deltaproteobacteria bacterium]|nr:2-oxoacid:acceptor oxidoreductase family protein [Deltaproteobacteria bacterium]
MNQQIIISGLGGQGILFLTKLLAQAAMDSGNDVITSETHGMAMRGGTVVSHVKIGSFLSPLIRTGQADMGFFLTAGSFEIHRAFLREGAPAVINTPRTDGPFAIDAAAIAREAGARMATNLVLLGFAVKRDLPFCTVSIMREAIGRLSPSRHRQMNIEGFERGLNYEGGAS